MAWRRPNAKTILTSGALVVAMALASLVFDNPAIQQPELTSPYFSGAANLVWGRGWHYSRADAEAFHRITSREQRDAYRFRTVDEVEPYHYQEPGYVYVCWLARNVFFWQGDLRAVESLQVLVHILITLFILTRLRRRMRQALFFALYGLNPLLLYFATFPLYYFWQVVPTALLLPYLLDRDFRYGRLAPLVVVSLAACYLIRPTLLPISMLCVAVLALRETRRIGAVSLAAAALCGVLLVAGFGSPRKSAWHSAYIGIGAYPNPYLHEFGDHTGYDLYQRVTGVDARQMMPSNRDDPERWADYQRVLRERYLEILRESPLLLLRNAALNSFQSFSLGYMTRSLTLSYLNALAGFAFCVLLLLRRRWLFALSIALASAAFAPFHPPVPAHMVGSYVLLVGAAIDLTRDLPWLERGFDGMLARVAR